jgi:hypothetical protein
MNADAAPAANPSIGLRGVLSVYRKETGQSLVVWALVALCNGLLQIILRREMNAGEFGTLNTALGVIGLMIVPMQAVNAAFAFYFARAHPVDKSAAIETLRAAAPAVTETFAWTWSAISAVAIFILLPVLHLPRFSLELFTLLNVLVALGGLVAEAISGNGRQLRLWAGLLIAAALTRLLAGAGLARLEPMAESGLAALLLAGFVTLTPALRSREIDAKTRLKACRDVLDGDFLLYAGATLSVLLGLFLFSSADRIIAQSWFGSAMNNNMGLVNWDQFDAYQTAGLMGRSLLWGTQPLLWMLFAQRSRLEKTRAVSLTYFWIHLGALVVGAFLLVLLNQPLCRLFCGANFQSTALFVPTFAAVMVLLGLLQALGVFALASRRYQECFVFGACSIGYAAVLFIAGRQPQSMLPFMFGSALIALMIVLFVGVVRWGRKQP